MRMPLFSIVDGGVIFRNFRFTVSWFCSPLLLRMHHACNGLFEAGADSVEGVVFQVRRYC